MNAPASAKRSHLAPFREGPEPWLVIARNALPVLGVFLLGWSAPLAVFMLWFDSVTALAALCALVARHGSRLEQGPRRRRALPAWLLAMALFGIPYWVMFLVFNAWYFKAGFWETQVLDPAVLAALGAILVANSIEEARRGFGRMTLAGIHREFRWQFAIHTTRALAILLLLAIFVVLPLLIVVVAAALSYVEIYPMRALRFFGREHEVDADAAHGRD